MEKEQWKKIPMSNYSVSNKGRVKNDKSGKVLKQQIRNNYYAVRLYINGTNKLYDVHRLVAEAFIPNPNNYPCINHKSEVKTENFAENLEWCDYQYNCNYGDRNRKIGNSQKRQVYVITSSGELMLFDSCVSVEKYFNIGKNIISSSIRQYGRYKNMKVGYVSKN